MNIMKNGMPKSSAPPPKKRRNVAEILRQFREKYRDDMSQVAALLGLSFLSALIIQETVDIARFLGTFMLTSLVLLIFYKDIKRYKPLYLKNYKMLVLLCLLITGTLLASRVFAFLHSGMERGLDLPAGGAFIYGLPVPIGSMLVTLVFDFHTAIIFSFVISLLAGIWQNNPLFAVYAFIGSLTAAFCVIRCKKRSALIKAGLAVTAINLLTSAIILVYNSTILTPVAISTFFFAAISGIMVAGVVSLILPVIEYLFGVTTDISLIELLDLDQPLMRNMLITTPGTYHHSVIVGNLAEAAAEAVGANPLLARVSAYYHDIGKMKMPEYFVENQTNNVNRHDKLLPHMSSMILTAHVKEGLELARQYKLPQTVTDIIQQHHGTSVITYFYQKAVDQSAEQKPLKEDYQYPGPKPQTRVAALVMMADAVEAASRTLTDPTPARIAAHVEKIINNIFLDGQIDECELTLKDISEIKRRFTHTLMGIFHRRIVYPEVQRGHQKAEKSATVVAMPVKPQEKPAPLPAPPQGNGHRHPEQPKADTHPPPADREDAQERSQALGP